LKEKKQLNVKIKSTKTNIKKYGVENALQNEDIKKKMKNTNIRKYGVEYSFQNEDVKKKIKETLLKKYGVENISKLHEFRNKAQETMLKKYGFRHSSQNPYISEKQFSNSNKIYNFPSGKIIQIQGYENLALDLLIEKYNDNEIIKLKDLIQSAKISEYICLNNLNIIFLLFDEIFCVPNNRFLSVLRENDIIFFKILKEIELLCYFILMKNEFIFNNYESLSLIAVNLFQKIITIAPPYYMLEDYFLETLSLKFFSCTKIRKLQKF
jgi:hypothetical protein